MKQMEMPVLSGMSRPELLDNQVIERCRGGHDAFVQTFIYRRDRMPQCTLADRLGWDRGNFSKLMTQNKLLDDLVDYMTVCGNFGLLQYLNHACGFEMVEQDRKKKEIQELEKRLEQLRDAV